MIRLDDFLAAIRRRPAGFGMLAVLSSDPGFSAARWIVRENSMRQWGDSEPIAECRATILRREAIPIVLTLLRIRDRNAWRYYYSTCNERAEPPFGGLLETLGNQSSLEVSVIGDDENCERTFLMPNDLRAFAMGTLPEISDATPWNEREFRLASDLVLPKPLHLDAIWGGLQFGSGLDCGD